MRIPRGFLAAAAVLLLAGCGGGSSHASSPPAALPTQQQVQAALQSGLGLQPDPASPGSESFTAGGGTYDVGPVLIGKDQVDPYRGDAWVAFSPSGRVAVKITPYGNADAGPGVDAVRAALAGF